MIMLHRRATTVHGSYGVDVAGGGCPELDSCLVPPLREVVFAANQRFQEVRELRSQIRENDLPIDISPT